MDQKYKLWIEDHTIELFLEAQDNWYYKDYLKPKTFEEMIRFAIRGNCSGSTLEMIRVFPELKRICGMVRSKETGDPVSQHFWCETKDGEIIDPTVLQFEEEIVYDDFRTNKKIKSKSS